MKNRELREAWWMWGSLLGLPILAGIVTFVLMNVSR